MTVSRAALPACVAAATIGATAFLVLTGDEAGSVTILLGLVPLTVSAAWGFSYLVSGSPRRHVIAVGGTLVVSLALTTAGAALTMFCYVVSGMVLGWSLRRSLRPDVTLGLALIPLIAVAVWVMVQWPSDQILADFNAELTRTLKESLPAGSDDASQLALLEEYERIIGTLTRIMSTVWPGTVLLGLLAHVGLVYLLVRWLARVVRRDLILLAVPSFHQWRVPFYLVWLLAIGLVFILSRAGDLPRFGLNLVLVTAVLFSVQGLAVQVNLLSRVFPPWARILFWAAAALFFAPVILFTSVLLGLVDQWFDLRRMAGVMGSDHSP
jgi:hypothetical protein